MGITLENAKKVVVLFALSTCFKKVLNKDLHLMGQGRTSLIDNNLRGSKVHS